MTSFLVNEFKIDMARAAPSTGSVPEPISSNKTKDLSVAFFKIPTIFVRDAENVERLISIDWVSPISTNISSKTETLLPS